MVSNEFLTKTYAILLSRQGYQSEAQGLLKKLGAPVMGQSNNRRVEKIKKLESLLHRILTKKYEKKIFSR